MTIRRAEREDIPSVLCLYRAAREYMKKNGNPDQWSENYPSLSDAEEDIEAGHLYVVRDDTEENVATFVFSLSEEDAYLSIDGRWTEERPYGVIHRVASSGKVKGITKLIWDWAQERTDYLRADTHENNRTMRHLFEKYGFNYCGVVYYVRDGEKTPRLAYDFIKN